MDEREYQPLYVGFYWTLPVRWTGFTQLSPDIDEASTQSRTIRYQRELARRHASANNGRLANEIAFMELDPEHGTIHVRDALRQAEKSCRELNATLLWVDFQKRSGWRGHIHLLDYLKESDVPNDPLFPENVMLGNEPYNPVRHFRRWRGINASSAEDRRNQISLGLAAALECIPEGYGRYPKIAEFLNEKQIHTQNGKLWNAETVRKAVADYVSDQNRRAGSELGRPNR